ncbi:MAG: enoyl-CoA hydratase-related protein [Rubrivivax sp.]
MAGKSAAPLVGVEVADGVATVTLRHPAKPNPITQPLQRELLAALNALRADAGVRALVLTAAGKAFCVGADLDEMREADGANESLGQWTSDFMAALTNPIVLALREMPVPVVCAVNGAAAGAGAGLAMAGDVLLMARSAYLYLPFVPRLGIVPDMGITWSLPRRAGRQRATALALLGERLGAEQAVQWGVAWAAVDDASLASEAIALARRLARNPRGSALELRRALDASEHNGLAQQLEYERSRQRELIDRPAFREGVAAFLEKREPRFHG